MTWSKISIEDRRIPGISAFAILLMIISLYMKSKVVLFFALFFLTIAIANYLYLKRAGDKLYLENRNEKNRFFVDGEGQWALLFNNQGYPILMGEIRVYFDCSVAPKGEVESSLSVFEIPISFSIFKNQSKQIIIPFSAKRRGIARIRKIEIHIPSLFGLGETILESRNFLKQQAIVYPEPISVIGLKEHMSFHQGLTSVPHSIYEDRLGPLGTRDYVSSDSFNRIHWKASARKQALQTKIYERISEKGWNISLNISNGHSITGNLERLISSITEFSYFAFSKNIPYSLCINVRTAGSTPFLYIQKGEGSEHLQRVLEMLASISTHSSSIPYEFMLSFFNRHIDSQPFFIHAGLRDEGVNSQLMYMSLKGINLFELNIVKEHGVLSELKVQREGRVLRG